MSVSQELQMSESNPVTKSPFGNLPFSIAGGIRGAFAGPLGRAFGFGGGKKSPYAKGQGPLGTFINQAVPMAASYMPEQVQVGKDIMGATRSAYGGYQNAVDDFMKQLPGFQQSLATATSGSEEALGLARRVAGDAFSPLPGRASFQETTRRALAPTREAAAARGMLESGQAQAGEQNLVSDLAYKALQDEQANQRAATGLVGDASQNLATTGSAGAQLAAMAPEMRGALLAAIPGLSEVMKGASGMGMDAMNNMMSFLTSTQNPNYSLLRMVLPTVANSSKSFGGGGRVGFMS